MRARSGGVAVAIALSSSIAGCGEECDPVGTYDLIVTYGAGDCGLEDTGTNSERIRVFEGADGSLLFDVADADRAVGTVRDDGGVCVIDMTFFFSDDLGDGITLDGAWSVDLRADGIDVNGSGTIELAFSDGTSCRQDMTIRGTKS